MVSSSVDQALETLRSLSVDDQLAFLWYVYEKMGSSITQAAPGTASDAIAGGLFNQVKEKSQEEQLQVMRDLANKKDTVISREYGSLDDNTKLAFWYFLAQGMAEGTIIPMPDDYNMAEQGNQLLGTLEGMEYESQITFLRKSVLPMGAEPKQGAEI